MTNKDRLYSLWENIPTDDRMFFLINESAMLIWEMCKAGDKNRLEDFRERLRADLSFADVELHELEIKDRITALLDAGIDEDTADQITELAGEIRGYLSEQACKSA